MALMRFRNSPMFISLVALLVGVLLALLMTTASSAASGSGASTRSGHAVEGAPILIRPVLCYAPPYTPSQSANGSLPACGGPYLLTAAALNVSPGAVQNGFETNTVTADPRLAGYASTTPDTPDRSVLLSDLRTHSGGQRYLVGPSEMRLVAGNVAAVSAQKTRYGDWIVKIRLTPQGAAIWDRVTQQNFHQFIAIDMGGKVVSAPIIEPTRSSFSSFHGVIGISGDINAATARTVAAAAR